MVVLLQVLCDSIPEVLVRIAYGQLHHQPRLNFIPAEGILQRVQRVVEVSRCRHRPQNSDGVLQGFVNGGKGVQALIRHARVWHGGPSSSARYCRIGVLAC